MKDTYRVKIGRKIAGGFDGTNKEAKYQNLELGEALSIADSLNETYRNVYVEKQPVKTI